MEPQRNDGGLSVDDDRPGQTLVGTRKFSGHLDGEHAPVPAGKKMRRLSHVGATRVDVVVRSYRNVDRLVVVAIEVADEEIAGAIRSSEPAFKGAGDARAELPEGLVGKLLD